MSKKPKSIRPKARLPKGLRDVEGAELRAVARLLGQIAEVYESYGFDPLETPAFEYTDALGKFLPDVDRPNAGVFSFQDEDEQWLSLRYDLTAPLARYVAANYDALAKPFRRYQSGPVWRNEKPGPGRYREFIQFDADTVGTASPAADAEMCMLAADALEALGLRGKYVIRVNNRKVLDGLLETIGVDPDDNDHLGKRLTILRALDKHDRLGWDEVAKLLGEGRLDDSGDYTTGAGLKPEQIERIRDYFSLDAAWSLADERDAKEFDNQQTRSRERLNSEAHEDDLTDPKYPGRYFDNHDVIANFESVIGSSERGRDGVNELYELEEVTRAGKFGSKRIRIDPSVVRGLDYYTGPVFEAELTFEAKGDDGAPVRFGSVGGGGRYDGLVARFKGIEVPATGFSVGVSRLYAALQALGRTDAGVKTGPVVVLVMDRERLGDYQKMTRELREAGIRAEMYVGESGMRAQMKYADKRSAPCVVIQGEDERAADQVTIKDLAEGARLSKEIADNVEWREGRPAQVQVAREKLVEVVDAIVNPPGGEADDR